MQENKERIAKRIANLGYCSRRDAEELILAKRVSVNGIIITTPVCFVDDNDVIKVHNQVLKNRKIQTKLFMYNKPNGLVCSYNDNEGRDTLFDQIKIDYPNLPRLISVGRLDLTSEGLLLLTNNGELSNILASPKTQLTRTYKVRVFGDVSQNVLEELSMGITIEGMVYQPILANILNSTGRNSWLEFNLKEGKNREIRRICEHLGLQVNRLIRTHFGPYFLNDLPSGEVKEIDILQLKKHLKKEVLKEFIAT